MRIMYFFFSTIASCIKFSDAFWWALQEIYQSDLSYFSVLSHWICISPCPCIVNVPLFWHLTQNMLKWWISFATKSTFWIYLKISQFCCHCTNVLILFSISSVEVLINGFFFWLHFLCFSNILYMISQEHHLYF